MTSATAFILGYFVGAFVSVGSFILSYKVIITIIKSNTEEEK